MEFEWDEDKAATNLRKHNLSFLDAATVFGDALAVTYFDPDHSTDAERFLTFGQTTVGDFVVVSHTDRENRVRIISARRMTRKERRQYEEGQTEKEE